MGFLHKLNSKLNSLASLILFFFEHILTLTAIEYHPDDNNYLYGIFLPKIQCNHLTTLHRSSKVICKPRARITLHHPPGHSKHLCDDGGQQFEQCTLILPNSSEKEVKIQWLHLIETAGRILSNRIQLLKLELNQKLNRMCYLLDRHSKFGLT